jgi:hypothetical protein
VARLLAQSFDPSGFFDQEAFARQDARFRDPGGCEASVIEESDSPELVAQALLAAVEAGRLLVLRPAAAAD